MKDDKKNIISEALVDYAEILKAATVNAKNKLANEMPDKFNNLLKEEISKNKKPAKDADEEINDVDELNNDNNKSVMKNNKKETKEKVNENVYAPSNEGGNEFNVTGNGNEGSEEDDFLTIDEIEKELNGLDDLEATDDVAPEVSFEPEPENGEEFPSSEEGQEESQEESIKAELMGIKSKLDDLLSKLAGDEEEDNVELPFGSEEEPEVEPESIGEPIDEIISDEEINAVLNGNDDELEEAHGVSYGARRGVTGRHTPNPDYLSKGEQDQLPSHLQESRKLNGLIVENKNLTKKVNEFIKYKKSADVLLKEYKSVLTKYRNQLTEMALFNTNLAHANNLLVNEEFALTQDDKSNIINSFKNIKGISESEGKYNSLLESFKTNKKTIVEKIEGKVVNAIQPSSTTIVENTVYSQSDGVKNIKRIMDKIESRR